MLLLLLLRSNQTAQECCWVELLPVSRPATNEMSSGVFQLLFMQGFLWNAGIGRTIPNRTSCECLPLIKPLSCTNTLHPAQTASRIWFWGIFLSPLCSRHLERWGAREERCLQTSHLMASCCLYRPEENTAIIDWNIDISDASAGGSCSLVFLRYNLSNCSLLRPNCCTIRKKSPLVLQLRRLVDRYLMYKFPPSLTARSSDYEETFKS